MSAATQRNVMEMSSSDFGLGDLDLNLSLHVTTEPLTQELQPLEPDSFSPIPVLNLAPDLSPGQKVVDFTRSPTSGDQVEEGGSQNSTLSTLSLKRIHPEEEPHQVPDRESPPRGGSDEEDGENARKKLRLTRDQSLLLEETFKEHNTLNPRQKQALAKQLGLRARQVEVWFQNRRARTKLKQTEAECEYMKRNCESLMDRVRRLQKEVNELRALKLAPQFYMQMPPATTLTLCPSCERVGIPTPAGGPVNKSRAGVERGIGPVSGGPWASGPGQMNHRPF
uniref:Homeobox domain-containing protein n=1 Tax=Kalanchoe fedtschenkoi TaxID=63787 RepID=A0A7N0VI56_KALFE